MEANRNPKGPIYVVIGVVLLGMITTFAYVLKNKTASTNPLSSATTPAAHTTTTPTDTPDSSQTSIDLSTDENGLSHAVVQIETSKGTIQYRFYTNDAPKTVHRMVELIQSGFYNGLTFHRVVPGFVIQGGDPQGNGTGGSGVKLPAEFNKRKHVPGAVAMARSQDPDSADSQFYIALGTIPHLDGQYTVFGQVISGQDVVEKIQIGDKMTRVSIQGSQK